MREFFRGCRRKAGCVTLVLACLLMGVWVRSRVYTDGVMVYRDKHVSWFVASSKGGVKWIGAYDPEGIWSGDSFGWFSHSLKNLDRKLQPAQFGGNWPVRPEEDEALWPAFYGQDMVWNQHWQMLGFCIGDANLGSPRVYVRQIPYWSIVLPMTILSAYLILWKPQKRTVPKGGSTIHA